MDRGTTRFDARLGWVDDGKLIVTSLESSFKAEDSEKGHTSTTNTVSIFKASKLTILRFHLLVPSV